MDTQNLLQLFQDRVGIEKDRPCFFYKRQGRWLSLNWLEIRSCVAQVASRLCSLGITKRDRVALLSRTCWQWPLVDLGILASGAITVPIYESSTPEQITYILKDCEARVIFVEDQEQLKKIRNISQNLPCLTGVVLITGSSPGTLSLDDFFSKDPDFQVYFSCLTDLKPNDVASIVYTSGTTGNPKGVVLTHRNFLSEIFALGKALEIKRGSVSLIFLPLAHILARVIQYAQFFFGFAHAYAESFEQLAQNIEEVHPHFLVSVPRFFEKIHKKILEGAQQNFLKRKIFFLAFKIGEKRSGLLLQKKKIPCFLKWGYFLSHALVFSKLHRKLGGRLEFFISGGAPLSEELLKFFHVFGFTILEGYGLTETTAAVSVNTFHDHRFGTVGKPLPGVRIRIASDGEILVKGDVVFESYFKNIFETKECFEERGWFLTGDIGAFDSDGFLKITDRKKDLIVTSGGKNIAPQMIENLLKTDPLISQVVVHGDKRRFLSALIVLNRDEVMRVAREQGILFENYEELTKNQKIFELIQERINEKNKKLASYQTIKKFVILTEEFSVESGELTPTLKIKRKLVDERYQAIFDGFYRETPN